MKKFTSLLLTMFVGTLCFGQIVISELNYNGPESGTDSTEFIELVNTSITNSVNLVGYTFSSGVTYTFPSITMAPLSFLVISVDSVAIQTVYGVASRQWTGGGLSNGGESVILKDSANNTVDSVTYDDRSPWPEGNGVGEPDGGGASLVFCNPLLDNADGANWYISTKMVSGQIINGKQIFGSPGVVNACARPAVVIPNTYSIGTVTSVDTLGQADSAGVQCYLSGTVFTPDFDGNAGLSFNIMDNTGGITVFNFNDVDNYVVRDGDSIRVRGEVSFYRGTTQLFPDSIWLLDSNKTYPKAKIVTALDETTDAEFIEIQHVHLADASQWPAPGNSANVDIITQAGDTLTMRIDSDTDVDDLDSIAPGCLFNIRGVGGQFDRNSPYLSGYQIFPRYFGDIKNVNSVIDQTVANISDDGGDISWMSVPGASSWNIGWAKGMASTMPTDSVMGITTNPYTIAGLSADTNTHYHVWIQDVCGQNMGHWDGPVMFSADVTSIDELVSGKVLVAFPNPNNVGSVRLNRVTDVVIRNLLGQPVIVKTNTDEIDINELSSGIYLLEAAEGDTIKLIVE